MAGHLTPRQAKGPEKAHNDMKEATLVCSERNWKVLRSHLLQSDKMERAAFLLLGRAEVRGEIEYYVHRFIPVPDEKCDQQHGTVVEPAPLFVLNTYASYAQSATVALVHAHSHPFCEHASFSGVDDAYLSSTVRDFVNYLKTADADRPHIFMRLVTGQSEGGFTGEVFDATARKIENISSIRVIGVSGVQTICQFGRAAADEPGVVPADERLRLDRNLRWLGDAGQASIAKTRLAICGLGGVGAEVLKICRGLGFKHYTLVDMDTVEIHNLNRLIWGKDDVGRLKTAVARDFIRAVDVNAEVCVISKPVGDVEAQEALLNADFIINAFDNDNARLDVQSLAARHMKPLLDLGSGITLKPDTRQVAGMGGQVSFYIPGEACLACQGLDTSAIMTAEHREVRRSLGYVEGTDETPASVVTINSVIAAIAGDIAMKFITGFSGVPKWIRYDMLQHKTIEMQFARRRTCPICGEDGIEGLGSGCVKPLPPPVCHGEDSFFERGKSATIPPFGTRVD